ncbi:hypothetical protein SAY87_006993 [Trapa incisa]|uniref:FLZ-type domain-containing protein n=1 Tax=Trapa incisa TaxID=236973 RepID=A0AAN7JZK4_9MYRT|nr:hypothetical protein SAY87_006993 [Trapa incisa]
MLGKRQRSMIGKLSELLVSGSRLSVLDAGASPRGPLELKGHSGRSPRGLKGYDLGGVGLGIVAAMEKSSRSGMEAGRAKHCFRSSTRVMSRPAEPVRMVVGDAFEDSEEFSYVTYYNGPNWQPCTRVYTADGREYCCSGQLGESRSSQLGLPVFPTSEFLSSCHSCGKKLQGEDIYMYRGEKAFCSTECRSRQITMDERKEERCRSEASRSDKLSSSPYAEGQIFSAGILAT